MGDHDYWCVWVEVVAKRGCEVDAESATVWESDVLSEEDENVLEEGRN
jgi:hypothetical protein